MGFESFQVELRGPIGHAEIDAFLRALPHARPDVGFLRDSAYYALEDGSHVFEVEVGPDGRLSCRFALCNRPSITDALLALVRAWMEHLGVRVRILDDVRPEHGGWYPLAGFTEFAEVLPRYVVARRLQWVAMFGPETFPATTEQACERFILPHCVPVPSPDPSPSPERRSLS